MFWFVLVNEMMIQIVLVFNAVLKSLSSIMMRRFKGSLGYIQSVCIVLNCFNGTNSVFSTVCWVRLTEGSGVPVRGQN